MDSSDARLRILCLCGAVLLGLTLTVAAFRPGYMSTDSLVQLAQARSGSFSDWHPPLMSWLWGRLDRVSPGPIGMLYFHNLLFWGALSLLAGLTVRGVVLPGLVTLAVGLLPPVFALLGTIWKDVGLGTALLLAFALLLLAERRASRWSLGFSIACLFYAFSTRHNSAPALLPLTVWAAWIFLARLRSRPIRRPFLGALLGGLALLGCIGGGSALVSGHLTGHQSQYPVQQILIHDLVAISVQTGKSELPLDIQKGQPFSPEEFRQIYFPDSLVFLFCCDNSSRRLEMVRDSEHLAGLMRAWLRAVLDHPWYYVQHRLRMAGSLLGWGRDQVCYPFQRSVEGNLPGVRFHQTIYNSLVMRALTAVQDSFLFRGWIYLLLSLGLTIWAGVTWRQPGRVPLFILSSSALLYLLPYLPAATACDFRLIWWSALAVLVSPLLVFRVLAPGEPPVDGRTR
ncbi:MAG TPA: hypothetical protein VGK67_06060 [Myxococcales bacterium]|jgi:hypothetical protein